MREEGGRLTTRTVEHKSLLQQHVNGLHWEGGERRRKMSGQPVHTMTHIFRDDLTMHIVLPKRAM